MYIKTKIYLTIYDLERLLTFVEDRGLWDTAVTIIAEIDPDSGTIEIQVDSFQRGAKISASELLDEDI